MTQKKVTNLVLDRINWQASLGAGAAWAFFLLSFSVVDWGTLIAAQDHTLRALHFVNPDPQRVAILGMMCVVGGAIAAVLHPMMLWTALSLLVAAIGVVSTSFYSYKELDLWWALPAIGTVASGVTVFLLKEMKRREMLMRLGTALEPVLPEWVLKEIRSKPDQLNLKDRQTFVSIMAVDIVGLAGISQTYSPEETMDAMRDLYVRVRKIVHSYGGVVLRGYRDGFTCFFGDLLHKGPGVSWHAEYALKCAADLQKLNGQAAITAAREKKPVLIGRVGISSARLILGNLGTHENFEFAIIGKAIEEARAYERSCEGNSILFGPITRDLLVKIDRHSAAFTKRLIKLSAKSDDMTEVFEFDPYFDNPTLRRDCANALRESAKLVRTEERWPIKKPELLRINTSVGDGTVFNVSLGGLALELNVSVTAGTMIRLKIDTPNEILKSRLDNRNLSGLNVEVRWSKPTGANYLHGVSYKSVQKADLEFLLQCILESQESTDVTRVG